MAVKRSKQEFAGSDGSSLAALFEAPAGEANAYALFAHCFTCGKDIAAASRISRALVARGIAVFRFDFTGLGGSDGDFSNTNFSSNVQDLIAASDYMREKFAAPMLLVGHSLGGTAVLSAAAQIEECKGVATIGAPADASHVARQFACDLDEINETGTAQVSLAGRQFTIKKQFVEDIKKHSVDKLAALKRDLLVCHSPLDAIVSINEAEKIFVAAKHPKSFVSLDKADHLLSRKQDAEYAAHIIAAWASRFVGDTTVESQMPVASGHVRISEKNKKFTRGVFADNHDWLADEPSQSGGDDLGPDPYEHLIAALGTCTSMTIRMYANHKKLALDDVTVEISHSRQHGEDCSLCDEENAYIELFERRISLKGDLTDGEIKRLLEIADRCPVHKSLHNKTVVNTVLANS